MKLFTRKVSPAAAPPPVPPVPPPPARDPRAETLLNLQLPDVFAFQKDDTKPQNLPRRPAPTAEESPRARRGVIVLVETDDEIRRLIARLLAYESYQVQTVSCLAEARHLLESHATDYVLARRACVPLNLQTEIALRELRKKTHVRIVDDFAELLLGQVVDYDSLAQCSLSLTDLLLSLLEGSHLGVRGHAHTLGKYCRLVGQRLGMSRRDLDALTLAALLHDLGAVTSANRLSEPTLTATALVSPSLQPTLDLLANVPFPYAINDLLSATGDTGGAPTETTTGLLPPVPLGARILRVVDTFETLRRTRTDLFPTEVALVEWLRRQPAGTFDLTALETFLHIRKQERAISALNLFHAALLFVDPQPADLQLLRLRLENDDYQVLAAHGIEDALQQLRTQSIALVVTEYQLARPGDGFELLRALKQDPATRHIPVVIHAPPQTDLVRAALELGAEDWYPKPQNVEITALKLERIVSRATTAAAATEGVQGSLRDLGLIEMVQILCAGGRSVHIDLDHAGQQASLDIYGGQLLAARHGDTGGDEAALATLAWREGSFRLRPLKEAPAANITGTTDALLRECCRHDQPHSPKAPA